MERMPSAKLSKIAKYSYLKFINHLAENESHVFKLQKSEYFTTLSAGVLILFNLYVTIAHSKSLSL